MLATNRCLRSPESVGVANTICPRPANDSEPASGNERPATERPNALGDRDNIRHVAREHKPRHRKVKKIIVDGHQRYYDKDFSNKRPRTISPELRAFYVDEDRKAERTVSELLASVPHP